MKKLLLLTALLTCVANVSEARPTLSFPQFPVVVDDTDKTPWNSTSSVVKEPSTAMQTVSRSEGQYTVTLSVDYDDSMMRLEESIFVLNPTAPAVFMDFDRSDHEMNIPVDAGTYDFVVLLADRFKNMTVLCARDIEVNGDVEVKMNVADATEIVSFRPVMPDGQQLAPLLYDSDQETVLDPGNAFYVRNFTRVYSESYGLLYDYLSYEMRMMYQGDVAYIGNRDMRFTPDSGLYVDRVTVPFNSDGACIIYTPAQAETCTAANDVNNYIILDENYLPSPCELSRWDDSETPFDKSRSMFASFWMVGGSHSDSFGAAGCGIFNEDFKNHRLAVCQPQDSRVRIWPEAKFSEGESICTTSYPFDLDNRKILAVNTLFDNAYLLDETGWFPRVEEAVNPRLSYGMDDMERLWGDGVPLAVGITYKTDGRYIPRIAYLGQLGENRQADCEVVESYVYVDGVEATDEQISDIRHGKMPEASVIEWKWVNKNISPINTITPVNRCVTTVNTSKSDIEPPTVQALRFHTSDGIPTLVFDSNLDARLTLYAGDFTCNPLKYKQWFSYNSTPEVQVAYAPHGSDDFTSLKVSEDEDGFFLPGFGACFTASLENVDRQSETLWYDLDIIVTDDAGNRQHQTLSPAFCLKTLQDSGVDNIGSEPSSETFSIYTAQGILIMYDATESDVRSLPAGLYITNGRKFVVPN